MNLSQQPKPDQPASRLSPWRVILPIWFACLLVSSIALVISGLIFFDHFTACFMRPDCEETPRLSIDLAFAALGVPFLSFLLGAGLSDWRLFRAGASWQVRLGAYLGLALTPLLACNLLGLVLRLML